MGTGFVHPHYEDLIEKNSIVLNGYGEMDPLLD